MGIHFDHWWQNALYAGAHISAFMGIMISLCCVVTVLKDFVFSEKEAKRHCFILMKALTWVSTVFMLCVAVLGIFPFTAVYFASTVLVVLSLIILFMNDSEEELQGIAVIFTAVISVFFLFSYGTKNHYDSRLYVEWKLTEISKQIDNLLINDELARMEPIFDKVVKYHRLNSQLAILSNEFALEDNPLYKGAQKKLSAFDEVAALSGVGIGMSKCEFNSQMKKIVRAEYIAFGEKLEAEHKAKKEADKPVAPATNVSENLASSKLVFVYREHMINFDLLHKVGQCFETDAGSLSLKACYTNDGIFVSFADRENHYSVSTVYSIDKFLNGPVTLDSVVTKK